MFKLLPRGAYPQAALQLIEALREYERELESRPPPESHYFRHRGRHATDFSWYELLSAYQYDPLKNQCLHRANWAKVRPTLYVSTYITERNNFVIEVRPCMDSGFRYGGVTRLSSEGDFKRFPIISAGFGQPTNRLAQIGLGELMASFRMNEPWVNHQYPGAQHARERHLLMLFTKAKLHQLSLYFECFLSRELVEFGPEHFIDFRTPSGNQDPVHKFTTTHSMEHYNHLDPKHWASPRIRERLATSDLDVTELYAFATGYLAGVDEQFQVQTYAEYLGGKQSRPLDQTDVDELFRCAKDTEYRATNLLAELAIDPAFPDKVKGHHLFDYFCRNFGLTAQTGLDWIGKHHPAALAHVEHVNADALIGYVKDSGRHGADAAVKHVDQRLATLLANDGPSHHSPLAWLQSVLDREAHTRGFASFDAFQLWAKDALPLTWAAAAARADRIAQRIAVLEADAANRKEAAASKRKATLAAKKSAANRAPA